MGLMLTMALSLSGCMSVLRPQVVNLDGSKPAEPSLRAKAQAELASGYVDLGRIDIAKVEVDKALRIDPTSPPANNVAGLIAMRISKFNEAETYFNRALRLDPENSHYQNNLALLYCKNGSPARGMELLRQALANKLYNTPQNSLMNAGICSESMGNWAEAEKYYLQAEKFENVNLQAKEKLALVYLKTGRADQAWLNINAVIAIAEPATPNQLRLAIAIARAVGRYDEASNLERRLKADYPDQANQPQINVSDTVLQTSPSPMGYGNMPQTIAPNVGNYGYQGNLPQQPTYIAPNMYPTQQGQPQYPAVQPQQIPNYPSYPQPQYPSYPQPQYPSYPNVNPYR